LSPEDPLCAGRWTLLKTTLSVNGLPSSEKNQSRSDAGIYAPGGNFRQKKRLALWTPVAGRRAGAYGF